MWHLPGWYDFGSNPFRMLPNRNNQLYCYLIDDDDDDREFFTSALQTLDEKITLRQSSNASQAIRDLQKQKEQVPNYIFLDLNMRPVDGVTCLMELKKLAHLADVPVIIYSTRLDEKIIYDTLQMGAFDHIEKPAKKNELVNYLKRVLQIADY